MRRRHFLIYIFIHSYVTGVYYNISGIKVECVLEKQVLLLPCHLGSNISLEISDAAFEIRKKYFLWLEAIKTLQCRRLYPRQKFNKYKSLVFVLRTWNLRQYWPLGKLIQVIKNRGLQIRLFVQLFILLQLFYCSPQYSADHAHPTYEPLRKKAGFF